MLDAVPVLRPRRRRVTAAALPFLFDITQVRRLLDAAAALPDNPRAVRRGPTHRTVFALCYGLGLRAGEACGLRLADVDVDRALLVVRGGKFGKTRLVPHGPRIGALLRALRRARAKAAELATAGVQDATAGRRRGRLRRAVNDLTDLLEATRRIAPQTCQRLSGITPDGATRRVSPHDGDARPIAKGRLGKPVEFGYKAQVLDNDDGVVLDHTVERGNPADAPQLAPAVGRVIRRTRQTRPG